MKTYVPPPTLANFLASNALVRCVVGPVGSGKSSACVVELVRRAFQQAPGPDGLRKTRFAVVRNTSPQLRDTTRKTFEEWIPKEWGEWHEAAFTFKMKLKDVESEIMFRALDRPEDVRRLLSLELTGAYINEAREIPKTILDVLEQRVGRYPSPRSVTWRGIWMDTNPWPKSHWGYKLFSVRKPEGYALFEQPGGRSPNAENVENLEVGYYARLAVDKDPDFILSYVDGGYPSADESKIFGALVAALQEAGRICVFDHPKKGVFTSWDLGINDTTDIWFWQVNEEEGNIDVVDFYENHGKPFAHYADVLKAKGYVYVKHYLPHDARARTLVTGTSTLETARSLLGQGTVLLVPKLSIQDGIQAARGLLAGMPRPRFHVRCEKGVDALLSYHRTWDDVNKCYLDQPVHDWSSNASDGFRYLAIVGNRVRQHKPTPPAQAPPVFRSLRDLTWDQLISEQPRRRRRG